jgi:hypothetical protein
MFTAFYHYAVYFCSCSFFVISLLKGTVSAFFNVKIIQQPVIFISILAVFVNFSLFQWPLLASGVVIQDFMYTADTCTSHARLLGMTYSDITHVLSRLCISNT